MALNEPTFYDACCGAGGFRLGLERAGFRCVGSCDNDKRKREIYKKNFGEYPTNDDIREMVRKDIQGAQVFTAGFPCPTFSIAGKKLGFEEPRGEIFFEIARLAQAARPRILLLENVMGLLSHDRGRTFAKILATLDEIRYDAEWWSLDGQYFVPQRRDRVFIIGHSRTEPSKQVFPFGEAEEEIVEGNGKALPKTAHPLDANYGKGPDNHGARTVLAIHRENKQAKGRRVKRPGEPAFGLTATNGIGVAIPVRDIRFNKGTARGRRMKTDQEPSFTMKSFATAGIYDGYEMRVFTPLEAERLMGFPDGWTDGLGFADRPRYRAMGDAVIPAVVEAIGKRLRPIFN